MRNPLDVASLASYIRAHVHPFDGELLIQQFGHGQSNPTYLLDCGGGSGECFRCVLRKKPAGKLLQSAHAIEREHRIMSALKLHSDVPVPDMLAYCDDESIIGTPFFLMQFIPGRIFKDPTLSELRPLERFAVYQAMCDTLARIHRVDWRAIDALRGCGAADDCAGAPAAGGGSRGRPRHPRAQWRGGERARLVARGVARRAPRRGAARGGEAPRDPRPRRFQARQPHLPRHRAARRRRHRLGALDGRLPARRPRVQLPGVPLAVGPLVPQGPRGREPRAARHPLRGAVCRGISPPRPAAAAAAARVALLLRALAVPRVRDRAGRLRARAARQLVRRGRPRRARRSDLQRPRRGRPRHRQGDGRGPRRGAARAAPFDALPFAFSPPAARCTTRRAPSSRVVAPEGGPARGLRPTRRRAAVGAHLGRGRQREARAACGTSSCRRRSSTSSGRRAAGSRRSTTRRSRSSWGATSGAPKSSIAPRPTRETWRCSRTLAPPRRRPSG